MKQSYKCPECDGEKVIVFEKGPHHNPNKGCKIVKKGRRDCPSCKGTGLIECEVRR